MTDTLKYPAQVFWSAEDEGFVALAADLPGCSAYGDTQSEALAELQHAIMGWREAAASAGNRIPEPSQAVSHYSGKFPLRLPKSLHSRLAAQAENEGVSLNHYINVLLAGEHERRVADADRRKVTTMIQQFVLGYPNAEPLFVNHWTSHKYTVFDRQPVSTVPPAARMEFVLAGGTAKKRERA